MSLRNANVKIEYRTLIDDMSKEFYIPLLKEASFYKRAVGFFSSSVLVEIVNGINGLVKNGGKIKIITSPNLSQEDLETIRLGYEEREKVIRGALRREMRKPENGYQTERLNILANLIADGVMDIRIAVINNNSGIGIYHEKVGIIGDSEGNKIAFSGSMNETSNALMANYETIDVFWNWSSDAERVRRKEKAFDSIWNDKEFGIRTYEMKDISDEFVRKYMKSKIDYKQVDELNFGNEMGKKLTFFKLPDNLVFYDYQKDAMANWIQKGCCGIYDMATGTGKTYTALGSLCKLSQLLDEKLAVVIIAPYKHLVEQWVEDIIKFNVKPIVAYSYRKQNWRKEFEDAVCAYNIGVINNFCIIATNATFSENDFQNILKKFRRDFCFVVDEAHNIGTENLINKLPKTARYRLALSATIERYRDEKGTEELYKYFGGKPCISYTLKEAIKNNFLTPYFYHPVLVNLDDDELEQYRKLTKLIVKSGYQNGTEIEKGSYLELLLIKRARIISGCRKKIDKLMEVIAPYKDDNSILVYCGATKYDREDIEDKSEIKQIDEVNRQLYMKLGMKVRKFTSTESIEDRIEIKKMFVDGTIQVITAIKCLDEGVNIPDIKTAFIMASSTNPKEYVQRRGRVLRKAKGKDFADIYDFITLPRPMGDVRYCSAKEREIDLSLINREIERMNDFADTAINSSEIEKIKQNILNTYSMKLYMEE